MSESNNHINYAYTDIEKYWKGQLSASEMHAMEKAALDDHLLAEAMEGYESKINNEIPVSADIDDLQERLVKRISASTTKLVPIKNNNWWKIAAVVLLAVAGVWVYTSLNNHSNGKEVAENAKVKSEKSKIDNKDTIQSFQNLASAKDSGNDVAVTELSKTTTDKKIPGKFRNKIITDTLVALNKPEPSVTSGKEGEMLEKNVENAKRDVAKNTEAKKELANAAPSNASYYKNNVKTRDDDAASYNYTAYLNTFNGSVVDNNNRPLSNATVKIPGQQIGTITNKAGFFTFKTADTALTVSIASVGYEPTKITLKNSNDPLSNVIILRPSEKVLNEVVVSGMGAKKKQDISASKTLTVKVLETEPSIGWNEYNDYLAKNKRLTDETKDIHGEVVVTFDVLVKGKMKNFKIEKSLDEDLDEEAIRLIKEGPAWRLLNGKRAKASVIVTF